MYPSIVPKQSETFSVSMAVPFLSDNPFPENVTICLLLLLFQTASLQRHGQEHNPVCPEKEVLPVSSHKETRRRRYCQSLPKYFFHIPVLPEFPCLPPEKNKDPYPAVQFFPYFSVYSPPDLHQEKSRIKALSQKVPFGSDSNRIQPRYKKSAQKLPAADVSASLSETPCSSRS